MDPKITEKINGVYQQPVPPTQTVGTGRVEAGARAEFIKPSESLPKVEEELAEIITHTEPPVPEVSGVGLTRAAENIEPNIQAPQATFPMSEEEARQIVKKGPGVDLDVSQHYEGIYFLPSKIGVAILRIKEALKARLFGFKRQPV